MPALLSLLPAADLRVIDAVGRLGTVDAVGPLHVLADRVLALDGSATAAREAIRSIQSRVVGAEVGGVSVVEVTGGALSTAELRGGEVAAARRRQREE